MSHQTELESPVARPRSMGLDEDLRFACPQCQVILKTDCCHSCGFLLKWRDGILHALPPARKAYYERFIEDYERIRAAVVTPLLRTLRGHYRTKSLKVQFGILRIASTPRKLFFLTRS